LATAADDWTPVRAISLVEGSKVPTATSAARGIDLVVVVG
jgi:hypothetical protein